LGSYLDEATMMICPYCGKEAVRVGWDHLYKNRPDLTYKKFWRCDPCDAHVGINQDGKPHGTMAKPGLRKLRMDAHDVFDRTWKRRKGPMDRGFMYKWLKDRLGYEENPHIGEMEETQCEEVIALDDEIETRLRLTRAIWDTEV
jgi:hypothetical protein